jgi:outer membrane protein assembly factor BamD
MALIDLKTRQIIHSLLFATLFMHVPSCTTEFEKVRTSNDAQLILKKANQYYAEEDWTSAQTLYELAIQYFRGKAEAENIYFNYANTYYQLGEYITASHYFKNFATTYTNSPKREEASFMSAYSNYKLSPNSKLDQSYSKKAIDGFQEFINNNPQSKKISDCNKLIDELRVKLEKKAFDQGLLYYNLSQFQSAVRSFDLMLREFPNAVEEERAKYLMLKSSYELANNSIVDKKQERFEETIQLIQKFKDKFKNAEYKVEAEQLLKQSISQLKKKK